MGRTAAIVSVGRELLTGRTVDRNATTVARFLGARAIVVREGFTVDDRIEEIARAVRRAWLDGAEVVVTIGGLGPTRDDSTLAGVALAWDRLTSSDEQALGLVRDFYRRQKLDPDLAGTTVMAELPVGAEPLPNPVGAAPAVWLAEEERATLSLPGVPEELEGILAGEVLSERIAPWTSGAYREARRSFPVTDERVLETALSTVRGTHPGLYLKTDPRSFDRDSMAVVAGATAVDADTAEAEARAGLDALARHLESD